MHLIVWKTKNFIKFYKIIGKTNESFEKHFWGIQLLKFKNVNGADIENRVCQVTSSNHVIRRLSDIMGEFPSS